MLTFSRLNVHKPVRRKRKHFNSELPIDQMHLWVQKFTISKARTVCGETDLFESFRQARESSREGEVRVDKVLDEFANTRHQLREGNQNRVSAGINHLSSFRVSSRTVSLTHNNKRTTQVYLSTGVEDRQRLSQPALAEVM